MNRFSFEGFLPPKKGRQTLLKQLATEERTLVFYESPMRLVKTLEDFGSQGEFPSHPELLDWLATRFVEEKWSVKAMQRLILESAAYRQSSLEAQPAALEADPDDRLLWRFNRLRLEGEAVRDSVLAVSGRLNPERGGLPVYPALPKGLDEKVQSVDTWETSADAAIESPESMLGIQEVRRGEIHPRSQGTGACIVRRSRSFG